MSTAVSTAGGQDITSTLLAESNPDNPSLGDATFKCMVIRTADGGQLCHYRREPNSDKILPLASSWGKTNLSPLLLLPSGEACRLKVTQFGLSRKLQLGLREVWHLTSWQ